MEMNFLIRFSVFLGNNLAAIELRAFFEGSRWRNKDREVSSVGLYNDLSQRGNIIGKNAIGSYCQIELCEPKVSRGA